jgi:uncharacterized membrane protein YGL010W
MKSLNEWLAAYAVSHQNPQNKQIHNIAVPVIFFCVVALFWKISFFLFLLVALGAVAFYYTMGQKVAIAGASAIGAAWLLQMILGLGFITLLIVFALAWAGQFYGHKLEGAKPSFFDDLKFLLIGPLWVAKPLLDKFEIR